MSLASQDLPSDPDALRTFAAALQAQLAEKDLAIAARDAEIHAKTLHIEKLKAQLAVLRRARFGRSSEKLDQAIEQLELLIGEHEEGEAEIRARAAAAEPANSAAAAKPRRAGGRQPLPEHLPRETITHPAPCACPRCGGTDLDAGLISAAQAVEHYEIARYGALRSWAELLGLDDVERLLEKTLDEERETDALLTQLAEGLANVESA